jgi:hypothetical protein
MTSRCCWFTQPASATRTNGSECTVSRVPEAESVGLGPAGSESHTLDQNSRAVVASIRMGYYNEWLRLPETQSGVSDYYEWLAQKMGNGQPWRTWARQHAELSFSEFRSIRANDNIRHAPFEAAAPRRRSRVAGGGLIF